MSRARHVLPLALGAVGWLGASMPLAAQAPPAAPAKPPPSASPAPAAGTPTAQPPDAPVPLTDIANNTGATRRLLDEISSSLAPGLAIRRIEEQLPDQYRFLDDFAQRTKAALEETPRPGKLFVLNNFWRYQSERLDSTLEVLNERAQVLQASCVPASAAPSQRSKT
jgi:hypothetical protein